MSDSLAPSASLPPTAAAAATPKHCVCVICYDESLAGLHCSEGCFTCTECLGTLIEVKAEELTSADNLHITAAGVAEDEVMALAGFIFCPCRGAAGCASTEPYSEAALARTVSAAAFASYVRGRTRLPVAHEASKAFSEAQAALQEELVRLRASSEDVSDLGGQLLAKQLAREMPDARQCAQCGYGMRPRLDRSISLGSSHERRTAHFVFASLFQLAMRSRLRGEVGSVPVSHSRRRAD